MVKLLAACWCIMVAHALAGSAAAQEAVVQEAPVQEAPVQEAPVQEALSPALVEADYYRIVNIPAPAEIVLDVGGIDLMDDGRPIVSTRRGEVFIVENALTDPPSEVKFTRFAGGLHEPMGVAVQSGWVYCGQRGELTRMTDLDGDDRADVYETVVAWPLSGSGREYAYGPKLDNQGNFWITFDVAHLDNVENAAPWRGWSVQVSPDGLLTPVCAGLRAPAGLGRNHLGDMFFTDTPGPWVGAAKLAQMRVGEFHGHPESLKWCERSESPLPRPSAPPSGATMYEARQQMPSLRLPAVWFPYEKMGRAAGDILCDTTEGKFGPFAHQLFIADQDSGAIMRVFLEQINGEYQGACFGFRRGFGSGVMRTAWASDGSMLVGLTGRGVAGRDSGKQGLQRLVWTGVKPFEIQEMRARADGFDLLFTDPIDPATARDAASYKIRSYTYAYHEAPGSQEMDALELHIVCVNVLDDNVTVRLTVENLRPGYVHELNITGVRSAAGVGLLHNQAYYTLNRLPQ